MSEANEHLLLISNRLYNIINWKQIIFLRSGRERNKALACILGVFF